MTKVGDRRLRTISRREEIYKTCVDCKRGFWSRIDKDYKSCRLCGTKVGRTLVVRGFNYIRLAKDDPYYPMCPTTFLGSDWLRLSRYTMAKKLGRCLSELEQVWHLDKNKLNDAPDNLILKTIERQATEEIETTARRTKNYKFGFDEGFATGYEEGLRDNGGDTLTFVERKVMPKPIQEKETPKMPKKTRKMSFDERVANQQYWAEWAREMEEKREPNA